MLVREETAAGVRYRMLDTVRAYGADWLAATRDGDRLRRRHRDWYLGLATWCELDWFSPRQAEIAARIEAELPNLRVALEQSLDEPPPIRTWASTWRARCGSTGSAAAGSRRAGTGWTGRWSWTSDHDEARLKALWVAGYVAVLQGDTVGALGALQECRDEAERTGNATAAAYALHRTGCLALVCDDMPRAEELLRAALARYREIGELNSNVLMGQVELAMAVAFQGELADAVRMCEDVREVCEEHGERWTLAYAQYVLAYAAWSRGRRRAGPRAAGGVPGHRPRLPRSAGRGAGDRAAGPGDARTRAMRRRRRCSRAPRDGSGRRWGCRCSARGTSTSRMRCARSRRASGWEPSATSTACGVGERLDLDTAVARVLRPARPAARAAPCGADHGAGHARARRLPLRERRGDGGLRWCCACGGA